MELFITVVGPLGWRYLNYLAYVLLTRTRFAKERRPMNRQHLYLTRFLFLFLAASIGTARAQDAPAQDQTAPPANRGGGRGGPGQGRGTMGKITAISGNSLEVTKQDGSKVTVKLTDATEFRKDRQPAKMADFKVGDMVMVRGAENPDHTVTAEMIGGRSGTGPGGGPGGFGGGGGGAALGEQGKDYVSGEVKSIDPPKLTVLRSDNVTQTLELNEDTSLRRGRESITMADIKVGDHIMARGAANGEVFVPKGLMVMTPEMWQRMQQYAASGANGNAAAPPASNGTAATAPKPQ